MSLKKKWILKDYDKEAAAAISDALSILPATAALLVERGHDTKKAALDFINKESAVMHDPFLLPCMEAAVKRIEQAVLKHEKIMVYGDYDVDGITGTAVLVMFFRSLGCDVKYHIPSRFTEGYGVNEDSIRAFAAEGVSLIVTVDTGVTAVNEAKTAKELGVDMIITDHHQCKDILPDTLAVINPQRPDSKYPFSELAGVGVAFKLICGYFCYQATGAVSYSKENRELLFDVIRDCYKAYGEIIALGTIADIMPVIDENRLIIAYGLMRMPKTKNIGLRALLNETELGDPNTKKKITTTTVSFTLAPRINAAGRLGDASRAVEMFLTEDESLAAEIARELCDKNRERQTEENTISAEAEKMISEQIDFSSDKIIILDSDSWHHGVIGIVSSRITDKYHLPSILISFEGDGSVGKGSGRSIECFNLNDALQLCNDLLIKFGGHSFAAGLSVERDKLPDFKERIGNIAREKITDEDAEPKVYVDLQLYPEDLTLDFLSELSQLEPFGTSNPVPLFMLCGLTIKDIVPVSNGKHLRITFSYEDKTISAMYFGKSEADFQFMINDRVDILFNATENEFRSVVTFQIVIRDVRFSDEARSENDAEIGVYGYIKDDIILPERDHIPCREECAAVFRSLRSKCAEKGSADINLKKLAAYEFKNMNYIKLRLILDIFEELTFIKQKTDDGIMFRITLNDKCERRELGSSSLFNKLNSVKD